MAEKLQLPPDPMNPGQVVTNLFGKAAVLNGSYLKQLFAENTINTNIGTNEMIQDTSFDAYFSGHAIIFITKPDINVNEAGSIGLDPMQKILNEAGPLKVPNESLVADMKAYVAGNDSLNDTLFGYEMFFHRFSDAAKDGAMNAYQTIIDAPQNISDGIAAFGDSITNGYFSNRRIVLDFFFPPVLANWLDVRPKMKSRSPESPVVPGVVNGFTRPSSIFLPDLTDRVRGIQFQNVGIDHDVFLTNLQQSKYIAPLKLSGESGVTFTMTFAEDSSVSVTKNIKMWMDYINAVTTGSDGATPKLHHLLNNTIDYKSSVYVFLTKPNMNEISFYAKYTGVMPSSLPISMLAHNSETVNELKLDIEFVADAFTYLEQNIIAEFNLLVQKFGVNIAFKDDEKGIIGACPRFMGATKNLQQLDKMTKAEVAPETPETFGVAQEINDFLRNRGEFK